MHTVLTTAQLRRIRWGVRAALALGVAASTAANILHAADHPVSRAISAWPPLALLVAVELIARVPVHRRHLAALRWLSTAVIAGGTAWVSYWHMVEVVSRAGETGAAPYLIPLSVDGLVVVASICLVELGGRIAAAGSVRAPERVMIESAESQVKASSDSAPIDQRALARAAYRASLHAGQPLSGADLGRQFGRSPRWGSERVTEVREAGRQLATV